MNIPVYVQKSIYDKITAQYYTEWWKAEIFPHKIRTELN